MPKNAPSSEIRTAFLRNGEIRSRAAEIRIFGSDHERSQGPVLRVHRIEKRLVDGSEIDAAESLDPEIAFFEIRFEAERIGAREIDEEAQPVRELPAGPDAGKPGEQSGRQRTEEIVRLEFGSLDLQGQSLLAA